MYGIDASQVDEGFLICGSDGNDYITKNGKWKLYTRCSYMTIPVSSNRIITKRVSPKRMITKCDPHVNYTIQQNSNKPSPKNDDVFVDSIPERKRGRPSKMKRGTREPTEYNKFISLVMNQVKKENPLLTNKECMQQCAKLWRQLPGST